jgi:hypothetical protein
MPTRILSNCALTQENRFGKTAKKLVLSENDFASSESPLVNN